MRAISSDKVAKMSEDILWRCFKSHWSVLVGQITFVKNQGLGKHTILK